MIDLKLVRTNPELMKDNIKKRNLDVDFDAFLLMDKKVLEIRQRLDEMKNQKNTFSKMMGTLTPEERTKKLEELKFLGEDQTLLEEELKLLEKDYFDILYRLPNFLDPTAAIGDDDG